MSRRTDAHIGEDSARKHERELGLPSHSLRHVTDIRVINRGGLPALSVDDDKMIIFGVGYVAFDFCAIVELDRHRIVFAPTPEPADPLLDLMRMFVGLCLLLTDYGSTANTDEKNSERS